jgi:flagellar protein FliO/FliZ
MSARLLATVFALLPAMATAQQAESASGVDLTSLTRLTIGLLVVIGAIVAVGWLLRRMGGWSAGGGQLRVLGGVSVGNRERILLVQAGKTQLLVGVAPGRVQTLHVLDEPIEIPTAGSGPSRQVSPFAARLRQVMQNDGKRKWDD